MPSYAERLAYGFALIAEGEDDPGEPDEIELLDKADRDEPEPEQDERPTR